MTPTPEQIEAATAAIMKSVYSGVQKTCCDVYREFAVAALTAAAEVVTEQHIERARTEARDDWIAKVGKTQGPDSFHPDLVARLTSAAAVRELNAIGDPSEMLVDRTIERCAQVAENYFKQLPKFYEFELAEQSAGKAIAAAIRALKEKL